MKNIRGRKPDAETIEMRKKIVSHLVEKTNVELKSSYFLEKFNLTRNQASAFFRWAEANNYIRVVGTYKEIGRGRPLTLWVSTGKKWKE